MSKKERTIYATVERGISGMYVTVIPDSNIPTYTELSKAVRKHIDLDKLIDEKYTQDKIKIGTVTINSNTNTLDSSDIQVTSIDDEIKQKYAI